MEKLKYTNSFNLLFQYSSTPILQYSMPFYLETHVAGCSWKGDHVTDIGHTGHELDKALKTESKAGVGS